MSGYEPVPEEYAPNEEDDFDVPVINDDDIADETGASGPLLSSTPAPEFQTAQKEKSGLTEPPAFLEDLSEAPGLSTTTLTAEGEIFKELPNADKTKIKYMMDIKGRTRVGLINPQKPNYNLLTQVPGKKWRIPDKPATSKRSFKCSWRKSSRNNTKRN